MRPPLAVALLGACLLSACGGGGGDKGASKPKPVTLKPGAPLDVTAKDFSFSPANVRVTGATASKPARLRIAVTNKGVQGHDLRVEKGADDLGGTPVFTGGQTRTATVRLKPGTYTMVCTVSNHEQLGMKGTIVVR